MPTEFSEASLQSRLQHGLDVLQKDLAPLVDLASLVERLEQDRNELRRQVKSLRAECERLRAERSQLLHAWADEHLPEEMLDRASQEPGGCTLAKWQRLGNT